jgi:hypothetical protein
MSSLPFLTGIWHDHNLQKPIERITELGMASVKHTNSLECMRMPCSTSRKLLHCGMSTSAINLPLIRYLILVAVIRPFDSRMWQALAQCYAKLARFVHCLSAKASVWLSSLVHPIGRPHEVLKCYKRAQLLVEPDDITNLGKLGDHCLSMNLLEEAAMYWTRIIGTATVGLA